MSFSRAYHLFQNADFLRVWLTGAICNTVRWLEFLAIGLFVFHMTKSAFDVSLIAGLRLIPLLLFGNLTGAIADRINRAYLLAASLLFLIIIFTTLAVLVIFDALQLLHIGIGAFLSGIILSGEHSVRRALLGEISGIEHLAAANGLDRSTDNITLIAGPLIGGIVFHTLGLLGTCIVICSMLVIAVFLIVRVPSHPRTNNITEVSVFSDIQKGLRFALRRPVILRVLLTTVIFNFCVWPLWALMPVVADTRLGLDTSWTGILMSITGVGSLAGALCVASFVRPQHYQDIFFYGSTLFLLSILLFSLSDNLWLSSIIFLVSGVGLAGFSTMQTTIIFSVSPPEMRSTVLGIVVTCIGTSPAGIALAGILADQIGATNSLALVACGGLLAMALLRMIITD